MSSGWPSILVAAAFAAALSGCDSKPEPTVHSMKVHRPVPAQNNSAPTWRQVDQRVTELEAKVADLEQQLR